MQFFRNLAGNIFFKIFLGLILLSFVFFGVSGYFLSNDDSWVAKIGNKTIGYNQFIGQVEKTKNIIIRNNNSQEALNYTDSEQFRSDILGRMVNDVIIEKLCLSYGIKPSEDLILKAIAKDKNFKDKEGKFDKKLFANFLKQVGFDEEKYVRLIQNEVAATMIIQTLSLAAPTNLDLVKLKAEFRGEKRIADTLKISDKSIKNLPSANEEELKNFYQANKKQYSIPEFRKIQFLRFSLDDFISSVKVDDAEIKAEYEKNIDRFKLPQTRNFLHLLFDDEDSAKKFIGDLNQDSDKKNLAKNFIKFAKQQKNKDEKSITLKNVAAKDLIADLSEKVFKTEENQLSEILKSPLGFHVFLTTAINAEKTQNLSEVSGLIKSQILTEKKQQIAKNKIAEIEESLFTDKSLTKTAEKFNLKANLAEVEINQMGLTKNNSAASAIADFPDFTNLVFASSENQISKLNSANKENTYFAFNVVDIEPSFEQEFDKVSKQVKADFDKVRIGKEVRNLAIKVAQEVEKNPDNFLQIAKKYNLETAKNQNFARIAVVEIQGQKIAIDNPVAEKLFAVKINQPTSEIQINKNEYLIAILRSISKAEISNDDLKKFEYEERNRFISEVMQSFNSVIMKKYPVKVNEKILGKN
jgi:peptidyl-prolyl cis-trans isomerase D